MPDIFISQPGSVTCLASSSALPARITLFSAAPTVGDPAYKYSSSYVILTEIGYNQATKQQFMASLGGAVYVYVFGDQMGSVILSGIGFTHPCNPSDKNQNLFQKTVGAASTAITNFLWAPANTTIVPITGGPTGIEEIMAFYTANKASSTSQLVSVTIGQKIISGFLTDLAVSTSPADTAFMISRFRLVINALPGQQTIVQPAPVPAPASTSSSIGSTVAISS